MITSAHSSLWFLLFSISYMGKSFCAWGLETGFSEGCFEPGFHSYRMTLVRMHVLRSPSCTCLRAVLGTCVAHNLRGFLISPVSLCGWSHWMPRDGEGEQWLGLRTDSLRERRTCRAPNTIRDELSLPLARARFSTPLFFPQCCCWLSLWV